MALNESTVDDAALEWFGALGYAVGHGPHLHQLGPLVSLRDRQLTELLSGELSVAGVSANVGAAV